LLEVNDSSDTSLTDFNNSYIRDCLIRSYQKLLDPFKTAGSSASGLKIVNTSAADHISARPNPQIRATERRPLPSNSDSSQARGKGNARPARIDGAASTSHLIATISFHSGSPSTGSTARTTPADP